MQSWRSSSGACFYFVGTLLITLPTTTASGTALSASQQADSSEESHVMYDVFDGGEVDTWLRADHMCKSIGTILLEITSAEVLANVLLTDQDSSGDVIAGSSMVWIGLHTVKTDCTGYHWSDGIPVGSWIPWDQGQPDHCNTEQCIALVGNKFRTKECDKKAPFICQRKEEIASVPTTEITDSSPWSTTDAFSLTTTSGVRNENTTCLCDPTFNFRSGLMTTSNEDTNLRLTSGFVPACNTDVIIKWDTPQNMTQGKLETVMALLAELQEKLLVMKNTTNTSQRKLISATNTRTSASTLGAVGVSLLIIEILFVVVVDFSRVFMKC